jgi:methyl-accepting chemotaxis protein
MPLARLPALPPDDPADMDRPDPGMAMTESNHPRRRLVVDPRFQFRFAFLLVLLHVNVGFLYQIALHYRMRALAEDAGSLEAFLALDPWKVIGPSMLLAGLVSSLVVFFLGLRYSHQIVGPLPRITRALRRIATGAQPERLQFRSGDILEELASEVNQVADRMQLTAKPAPEPRVDPASILGEPRQSQPVGS